MRGGGWSAHLSDVNADLIETYQVVRDNPSALMALLDEHAEAHCKDYYYAVRAQHSLDDMVERAARFIFINKTGFNGLIRYNRSGLINTPFGHKKNPVKLYDEDNILACSRALRGVELRSGSYEGIEPKAGDFVYFDPPYFDAYGSYSKDGFGVDDQEVLAAFCRELDAAGVMFMLSNSLCDEVLEWYDGFRVEAIEAPRAVSCKGDGRKAVKEVLVMNY